MNVMLDTTTLESDVEKALEKGFLATMLDVTTDDALDKAKEMAAEFAAAAAPDMASAIEKFVKTGCVTYDGSAMVQTFTVVGTCAVGAVTGTATGTVSQPYKMV